MQIVHKYCFGRNMNTLRVIGGKWRGRKLPFVNSDGLRPTTDRVRETLFNWLMMDIQGARCLDLFAGSGLLGFEALSRGASHVVMLDSARKVVQQLKATRDILAAEHVRFQQIDALQFIATYSGKPFDIIFIDPPFHQQLVAKTLASLRAQKILAKDGLIYVEQEKKLALPEDLSPWEVIKTQSVGQVDSFLLR
jgi:16S rRNA (guanine966-N2)-methyltransferase